MSRKSYIVEIHKDYEGIDGQCLKIQYKTSIGLVAFSFIVECLLGVLLCYWNNINTTIPNYILKYIMVPFFCNIICLLIGYLAMKSNRITQKVKVYLVLFEYVLLCFILFTVHSIFPSLSFIFAIPIVLTAIYGDYLLTTMIAGASIGSYIISEVFLVWDPKKADVLKDRMRLANFMVCIFILIAFFIVCMVLIRYERVKNVAILQKELERQQLQQQLQLDELTMINNRFALKNALHQVEVDESDNAYIFVMIDLDNFKMLNDTFGHPIGDQCLLDFGNILKEHCTHGTPYRFGGDEFCILFSNQSLEHVVQTCERIQKEFDVYIKNNHIEVPLSASFGIAHFTKDMSSTKLLKNSDQALYEAKVYKNTIHVYRERLV